MSSLSSVDIEASSAIRDRSHRPAEVNARQQDSTSASAAEPIRDGHIKDYFHLKEVENSRYKCGDGALVGAPGRVVDVDGFVLTKEVAEAIAKRRRWSKKPADYQVAHIRWLQNQRAFILPRNQASWVDREVVRPIIEDERSSFDLIGALFQLLLFSYLSHRTRTDVRDLLGPNIVRVLNDGHRIAHIVIKEPGGRLRTRTKQAVLRSSSSPAKGASPKMSSKSKSSTPARAAASKSVQKKDATEPRWLYGATKAEKAGLTDEDKELLKHVKAGIRGEALSKWERSGRTLPRGISYIELGCHMFTPTRNPEKRWNQSFWKTDFVAKINSLKPIVRSYPSWEAYVDEGSPLPQVPNIYVLLTIGLSMSDEELQGKRVPGTDERKKTTLHRYAMRHLESVRLEWLITPGMEVDPWWKDCCLYDHTIVAKSKLLLSTTLEWWPEQVPRTKVETKNLVPKLDKASGLHLRREPVDDTSLFGGTIKENEDGDPGPSKSAQKKHSKRRASKASSKTVELPDLEGKVVKGGDHDEFSAHELAALVVAKKKAKQATGSTPVKRKGSGLQKPEQDKTATLANKGKQVAKAAGMKRKTSDRQREDKSDGDTRAKKKQKPETMLDRYRKITQQRQSLDTGASRESTGAVTKDEAQTQSLRPSMESGADDQVSVLRQELEAQRRDIAGLTKTVQRLCRIVNKGFDEARDRGNRMETSNKNIANMLTGEDGN